MGGTGEVHFRGFAPYLYYEDAAAALEWLAGAFGFVEKVRYLDDDGVVREAEMLAGETVVAMHGAGSGYWAEQGVSGPVGQSCIVYVDNVDALWERIRAHGVDGSAPVDKPYGARICMVDDIGGHSWTFWQHLTDDMQLDEGWQEVRS
jgi:uncharacterized glyoxalase superfamily protein PhnB